MRGEYNLLRAQLKGYLFEIVVLELLRKNGFNEVQLRYEPEDRIREIRDGFIEFKGRGCWHQIDIPCDYQKLIPFSYPLRLLGEAKFYKKKLDKKFIRSYIGVLRDIQENYFVSDNANIDDMYPRRLEVGVYFAANGFQNEAEKLAYAHGIKTISYANNPIINRINHLIDNVEENYISVKCFNNGNWLHIKQIIKTIISNHYIPHEINQYGNILASGFENIITELSNELREIHTSFIGTTGTGVFIHFISTGYFPIDLFQETDHGFCRVYYEYDNFGSRFFWLEIAGDQRCNRFYFTPPESLDAATLFGQEFVLGEKERIFRVLNVSLNSNGITRNLVLQIDGAWVDEMRNRE